MNANTGSGLSYQWTLNSSNINGATAAAYTANASGNYAVIVTNSANCSTTSSSTTITVNALPTATGTAAGATTFCQGGNVVLNANAGSGISYQWILNGSNINGETNASYTANASGNYAIIVTDNNTSCSKTSASTSVTVISYPTATNTAVGSTTFCLGANVVLNANTGSGLSYQWTLNSSNINGATAAAYTANASGNYAVVVTNSSICSTTSTEQTVTVNQLPVVTLGSITSPVCVNHALIALAGTPVGGNYSGVGVSGSYFDPAVSGAGAFNVLYTYTDGNSCSANATQSVVVDLCTGIAESANGLVSIYPNPVNDLINVVLDASLINNTTIEIYDGIGKLVVSEKILNEKTVYKINSFENGIYTVRIVSNNKQIVNRILKN